MTDDTRPSLAIRLLNGLFKLVAIGCALPLTVLCLMAAVGLVSGNLWIRLGVASVAAIVVPLILVDRLLPEGDQRRARGLATDVLALTWSAFVAVFAGAAHGATSDWLAMEGDRLAARGMPRSARVSYWLAAVRPVPPARSTPRVDAPDKRNPAASHGPTAAKRTRDRPKRAAAPGRDAGVPPATTAKRADAGAAADAQRRRTRYSAAELFRTYAPAVVSIKVSLAYGQGGGTGFFIDDAGTIATNSHVIHGARKVAIKLKNGVWVHRVELLMENTKRDLALLRIRTRERLDRVTLGDSDKTTVGEHAISIGNPLGLEHTLTDGLISARRVYLGQKWIQMSTPVSPGNSGGPLFNAYGEVVGITTAVIASSRAQNLNLAVPVNDLKTMIKPNYPKRRVVGTEDSQTW